MHDDEFIGSNYKTNFDRRIVKRWTLTFLGCNKFYNSWVVNLFSWPLVQLNFIELLGRAPHKIDWILDENAPVLCISSQIAFMAEIEESRIRDPRNWIFKDGDGWHYPKFLILAYLSMENFQKCPGKFSKPPRFKNILFSKKKKKIYHGALVELI